MICRKFSNSLVPSFLDVDQLKKSRETPEKKSVSNPQLKFNGTVSKLYSVDSKNINTMIQKSLFS